MMKKLSYFCLILSVFLFLGASSVFSASLDETAGKIENSFAAKKPYGHASQEIDGLTVDQAYEIQARFVKIRENKGDEVMGYKAGLTSAAAQQKFGVKEAARGTLFKSMFRWPGTLYQKNFARMFIETW
ncbi:MAG: hypothetical protein HGJ93_13095 [Desulfosarcina sp.]|nr:hypothetical protein [Desulfosarcina sp.]MBC2766859.1 hypothetical protein [Desulfosarcina sp.]